MAQHSQQQQSAPLFVLICAHILGQWDLCAAYNVFFLPCSCCCCCWDTHKTDARSTHTNTHIHTHCHNVASWERCSKKARMFIFLSFCCFPLQCTCFVRKRRRRRSNNNNLSETRNLTKAEHELCSRNRSELRLRRPNAAALAANEARHRAISSTRNCAGSGRQTWPC